MKDGSAYLLIDTNVWLAAYLPNRAGHKAALQLFSEATKFGVQILYAAATIRDVFYIAERELKEEVRQQLGELSQEDTQALRALAWGMVDNMREMGTAVGLDESDLWFASKMRSLHSDLEDNIVRAAAKRAKADLLITYDEGLLSKASVPTMTPEDAILWLQSVFACSYGATFQERCPTGSFVGNGEDDAVSDA